MNLMKQQQEELSNQRVMMEKQAAETARLKEKFEDKEKIVFKNRAHQEQYGHNRSNLEKWQRLKEMLRRCS